jgi:hypothetical protein
MKLFIFELISIIQIIYYNFKLKSKMTDGGPGGALRQMDNHDAYNILDEL